MQKIIAVTGLKGSGKDTIASIICEHDTNFKTIAFADKLKDICAVMFNWDREMLSGRFPESREWREQIDPFWSKELGVEFTPRKALTTVGTDIIRGTILSHIWDIAVKKEILDHPETNYVITDCRFPNELNMIKSLNGTIVQVERGERPTWWNIAVNYNFKKLGADIPEPEELKNIHPSERDWIGINNPEHIFYNNDTIENLEKTVVEYFNLDKKENK